MLAGRGRKGTSTEKDGTLPVVEFFSLLQQCGVSLNPTDGCCHIESGFSVQSVRDAFTKAAVSFGRSINKASPGLTRDHWKALLSPCHLSSESGMFADSAFKLIYDALSETNVSSVTTLTECMFQLLLKRAEELSVPALRN